jgi:hypothetical protein
MQVYRTLLGQKDTRAVKLVYEHAAISNNKIRPLLLKVRNLEPVNILYTFYYVIGY